MVRVSIYSLDELAKLSEDRRLRSYSRDKSEKSRMKDQIQTLQLELGFLKMFLLCLPIKSAVRGSFVKATTVKSKRGLYDTGVLALCRGEFEDWDNLTSKLLEKIEQVKPRIRKICLDLLDGSFKCNLYKGFRLHEFLDLAVDNLRNLLRLKSDKLLFVEMQIKTLEEKLSQFRDLVDFTTRRCTSPGKLKKFTIYIQPWAEAAYLLFLYLDDGMQEEITSRLNDILFLRLERINTCTPELNGMYLRFLKTSKSTNSENLLMGEIVSNVVDSLLESAAVPMNESIKTLRDGLIILTTFLMNPPWSAKNQKLKLMQIWKQTDTIVTEVIGVICSLNGQQTNEEALNENRLCSKFYL